MSGRRAPILAISLLVVAVALTPLGSILNGGVHETWLPRSNGRGPVRVLVHDRTGLVAATSTYADDGVEKAVDESRVLLVPWSVCGGQADLVLARTASGFEVQAPTVEFGWCSWFTGSNYGMTALSLRAQIDPVDVDFRALDASVR